MWESRINNIEAVQYQTTNIMEVSLKFREVFDPQITVEFQSLAKEMTSCRLFLHIVCYSPHCEPCH